MRDLIERRLAALRAEYEAGEEARASLEARQADLRETMLRITGGILVLEGLLAELDVAVASTPAPLADDPYEALDGRIEAASAGSD
jgi:hypothetical protein